MRLRRSFPVASLAALFVLTACGGADRSSASADATAAPSLEVATSLGVPNAREPLPNIVTAGQPTQEQFAALAAAGFTRFISLRPASEQGTGWEESWAEEHGVQFLRNPIGGAPDLTRENVQLLDAELKEGDGVPTVVYCASSNRAGAMLALRAAWLQGATPAEALELGKAAGMTRLEPEVAQLLGGS